MEISSVKIKWWQIAIFLVLILGIVFGIILLQKQQLIKSRATGTSNAWMDGFELKDFYNNPLSCDTNTDPPECTINGENSTIRVKDIEVLNSYVHSL